MHITMRANVTLKTRWFSAEDKEEFLRILCKGDLLEFNREAYNHWAVCVAVGSDPIVVHRTGTFDSSSEGFADFSYSTSAVKYTGLMAAIIKKATTAKSASTADGSTIGHIAADLLWDVLSECRVRINNSGDAGHQPRDVTEIVATALLAVDSDAQGCYNLLKNNCEHFANFCRYGEPMSHQAFKAMLAAGLSMTITTAMILLKIITRLR